MPNTEAAHQQPMSIARQIAINAYWFSMNMMWATILLIIMPGYIQSIVGDVEKGKVLGLVLSVGAIVSMLAAPLFGMLSDRVRLPGGRRRPWIIFGTLAIVPVLWALSYWTRNGDESSLFGWVGVFLLLELVNNIAAAPCSALIPDLVPPTQRGSAAGWLGLMSMLGIFAGASTGFLIAPFGIPFIFGILTVVMVLGALVTGFAAQEANAEPDAPRENTSSFVSNFYLPFKNASFTWVFFNRLLIGMGVFTIQEFIFFYMKDAFKPPYILPVFGTVAETPQGAVSIFLPALFLGAIATSLVAGLLSDRFGRKPIAYAASLILGLTCMVFTFSHSFPLSILMGVVFGLGYGAYDSLAWAMASDVLRSPRDHAKDMGIWHIAVVLPQVIATPIGGFLLDHFQATGAANNVNKMGYIVIFIVAAIYFMCGAIILKQIKGLR